MGRVLTNTTSLLYSRQVALDDFSSTVYKSLEPNGNIVFGPDVTTTPRNPISKNRQRRKGSVTDQDSPVSFDADLTMDALHDFAEGFCFATAVHADLTFTASDATGTTDLFAVASLSASQAARLPAGALLWAAGYVEDGNNGLHVVTTGASASDTSIACTGSTLVTETAPTNAEVSICGVRPSSGDITIAVSAGVATVTSASDVSDWSVWLTPGQLVHIGGVTTSTQSDQGAGFARVKTVSGASFTADKLDSGIAADASADQVIDILFGRFVRNVPVDDSSYLEQYFLFEAGSPNLFPSNVTGFEYAKNNLCNTLAMNLQGQSLATISAGFVGTTTDSPVVAGSRLTGASSAREPLFTAAVNTSADFGRLRITDVDETGLTTDFSDMTATLNNNVTPEKVLSVLGARYLNTGNFEVTIEATTIFTSADVLARIKANTTVTMDWLLQNADGAVAIDIPSMTLSGGGRDYALNESVKINLTCDAFQDPTLGTSIGISFFPVTPVSYAAA